MSSTARKIKRENFNTTIDPRVWYEAMSLVAQLKAYGIKKDGVNELIEEGLRLVHKKYIERIHEMRKEELYQR